MAYYGNILIVYNSTANQIQQIETVLQKYGADHELVENSFFLETSSMTNTEKIVDEISQLPIEFIFFHSHNADGSEAVGKGIDDGTLNHIKSFLEN